jgi:hypothetical protein
MAEGRDVRDATFACPDLTTFTRLDEPGFEVIRQRLDARLLPSRAESAIPTIRRAGVLGADAKAYRTIA